MAKPKPPVERKRETTPPLVEGGSYEGGQLVERTQPAPPPKPTPEPEE